MLNVGTLLLAGRQPSDVYAAVSACLLCAFVLMSVTCSKPLSVTEMRPTRCHPVVTVRSGQQAVCSFLNIFNLLQYSCLEDPMDGVEEPGRLQSMGSQSRT